MKLMHLLNTVPPYLCGLDAGTVMARLRMVGTCLRNGFRTAAPHRHQEGTHFGPRCLYAVTQLPIGIKACMEHSSPLLTVLAVVMSSHSGPALLPSG